MAYAKLLKEVRRKNPLVLCLTNFVTANDCANGLLAIGASPVMSLGAHDALELLTVSSALALNIGTINSQTLEGMLMAAEAAKDMSIPVVLDPVGAGATRDRLMSAITLMEACPPAVIRGNASEIAALDREEKANQKGVDSSRQEGFGAVKESAERLAKKSGSVVAVTGSEDVATDGSNFKVIHGGSPLLTKVTGTGCLLSAMCGAFLAVSKDDPLFAAASAMALMKRAGELAAESLGAPGALGEFKMRLFDQLALA